MADELSGAVPDVGGSGPEGLSDVAQEVLAGDIGVPGEKGKPKAAPAQNAKRKPEGKKALTTPPLPEPIQNTGGFEGDEDAAPEPEEFELKANGKTFKAKGVDELKAHAQRGIAAQQQMQKMQSEFAQLKRQMQERISEADRRVQEAEKDPVGFFKRHNEKAEDLMEQVLLDRAREQLMLQDLTPREREMYLQNKQLHERLAADDKARKEAETHQEQQLRVQQREQIGNLFGKVLTDNKMPVNEHTIRTMSQVTRALITRGVQPDEKTVAELTKRQLQQIADAYSPKVDQMRAEEFVEKYPKLTEAIRQVLVKKSQRPPTELDSVPRKPNGQYKKSADVPDEGRDWDNYIEKLKKEGNALRFKNGFGY